MHPRTTMRSLFANDDGTFNMTSIIVGALLVLGLVAGLTVGLTRLLPWGQDMNAKEDLSAVRTAESVTRAKGGKFLDDAGLKAAGYLDVEDRAAVETNAEGTCYVAIAKSRSGKFFFTTDTNSGYQRLLATTPTGDCLDIGADEQLRLRIGAPIQSFGPLENGSFEDGFRAWTTGSVSGGELPAVAEGTAATKAFDGVRLAKLVPGGFVEQGVRLPAGAAYISYQGQADGRENSSTAPTMVSVFSRTGEHLGDIRSTPDIGHRGTARADLSEFAGQDVTLRIVALAGNYWNVHLDNVQVDSSVTPAPTQVVGYTYDHGAAINWKAPATGEKSVTSYIAAAYLDGEKKAEVTVPGSPPATSAVFSGLENGERYTFTVRTVNAIGVSAESASSPAYLVEDVSILNPGFEAGLAGWEAGNLNAGGTLPTSESESLRNLNLHARQYVEQRIRIPDVDGMLNLTAMAKTIGTYTNSSTALGVTLIADDGTVLGTQVSTAARKNTPWEVSVDLTDYRGMTLTVRLELKVLSSATSIVVDDLAFETTVSTPPTAVTQWSSDRTAHLSWTAPAGGAASVTEYRITAVLGGAEVATRAVPAGTTDYDFTGLENGKNYTFRITAVNPVGESSSAALGSVLVDDYPIFNGSLEGGLKGWDVMPDASGALPSIVAPGQLGAWAVLVPAGASIQTTVLVPDSGGFLNLKQRVGGGNTMSKVQLLDQNGNVVHEATKNAYNAWDTLKVALGGYAGQRIIVKISGANVQYDAFTITPS